MISMGMSKNKRKIDRIIKRIVIDPFRQEAGWEIKDGEVVLKWPLEGTPKADVHFWNKKIPELVKKGYLTPEQLRRVPIMVKSPPSENLKGLLKKRGIKVI